MSKISKTTAHNLARRAVSAPIGRGTSWMVCAPWDASTVAGLRGPRTEIHTDSYSHALTQRTRCIVRIALTLLGYEDAEYLIEAQRYPSGNARELLNACIRDNA